MSQMVEKITAGPEEDHAVSANASTSFLAL
jgi:hypothetical protein